MTQDFGLAILYLTALAAYLSLGWHLYCAGRWLYRWLHPWNEEVDARAREYLVKPHPLWEMDRSFGPLAPGKRPTTARATTLSNLDAQEADCTIPPIPLSWPSGRRTTWTRPAGQHSPFAVRQDVSPDGERTPVSDAPETG